LGYFDDYIDTVVGCIVSVSIAIYGYVDILLQLKCVVQEVLCPAPPIIVILVC